MSLVSPELLAKASAYLDTRTAGLIPEGKTGAAVLVLDMEGGVFGMAYKRGHRWTFEASLEQRWVRELPTAQIRVKAVW